MRILLTLTASLAAVRATAQFAIGGFGGLSEDRIWQTELAHAGVLCEFRTARIPGAVIRASFWSNPKRSRHEEVYASVEEPAPQQWLALVLHERMSAMGVALDLKFPFEDNPCADGYYKGTYVLAGLGYAQRWHTVDRWEQERDGRTNASQVDKVISEPMLRAGFGGEWNFKWGGPFVEGLITVSAPGLGPPSFRFPGAAILSVGYRYSFAHPLTAPEIEDH